MVFFVMTVVILAFVVLWTFDVHRTLKVKAMTQNGGDAAALMGARWQAVTLNLIGDLNLLNAVALSTGDSATSASISNIQARLCYVGPMIAFLAAQQAAKNNGLYRNTDFDTMVRDHAEVVRRDYPTRMGSDGQMLFPEPYPGCWEEYAAMLDYAADEGVAVGADNARLYTDYTGGHILLTPAFYEAIAGRIWCWFFNNAPTLLEGYRDFQPCWWPPLPVIPHAEYMNSEIFGLGLTRRTTSLSSFMDTNSVAVLAAKRGLPAPSSPALGDVAGWYCYSEGVWTEWTAMSTEGADPFPAAGTVRAQYNYSGADAVTRAEAPMSRLTPGTHGTTVSNTIVWTAAAKPFGYLNDTQRPDSRALVLPAFHDVRLIPLDASSSSEGGAFDLEWRRHIEEHLPKYMQGGPSAGDASCWYCQQLTMWEQDAFRQAGVVWLSTNSYLCTLPSYGGSGGPGGGRRRGH